MPAAALESLPSRGKQSPAFKQFFESNLCDDFLCAALDHFAALLRLEDMIKYFLVRSCRVLRVCVLPCVVCARACVRDK